METQFQNGSNSRLREFFIDQLQEISGTEERLLSMLSQLQEAVIATELRSAVAQHITETKTQTDRLKRIFELLNEEVRASEAQVLTAISHESTDILEKTSENTPQRDAVLIIVLQKAVHYEIACYGSLSALAKTLGHQDVAVLLNQTLAEKKEADALLTQIAVTRINDLASREPSY